MYVFKQIKTAETRCFYTPRNWVRAGRVQLTINWSCGFLDHNLYLTMNGTLLKGQCHEIFNSFKFGFEFAEIFTFSIDSLLYNIAVSNDSTLYYIAKSQNPLQFYI
jgi:hypothetical protein